MQNRICDCNGDAQDNTIGGGATNLINQSCATLSGQYTNKGNTISGGYNNLICSSGASTAAGKNRFNVIGGGKSNRITNSGALNTISGGYLNTICLCSGGAWKRNFIGGGSGNMMRCNTRNSVIGGGINNSMCCVLRAGIFGGVSNFIKYGCDNYILGGCGNKICSDTVVGSCTPFNNYIMGCSNCIIDSCACDNAIVGGLLNKVCCKARYNIVGGFCNCAGGGSTTNQSIASAIFGRCNRSCGDNNFVVGCNNNAGCCNQVAILGAYSKTATANNQLVTCCICAYGSLSKSSGTFTIDHPNPEKEATHNLKHSFVESPTAGDNIYRFEIEIEEDLQGEIILPEYYRYLNTNSQVWVNPVDNLGRAFGLVNLSATKVKITASDPGKYNVLVVATRKDKAAVEAWKGVEVLKTKEEKINYQNQLKYQK